MIKPVRITDKCVGGRILDIFLPRAAGTFVDIS